MITESFVIRTTISTQLMKSTLLKGFCIAFLGIAGLLVGSIFFSLPTLQIWGLSLFLISLGLITFGLVPYRRLSRLQLKPNECVLTDSDQMIFYSKGKKILTIPLQSVARFSYIQHPSFYGIAVWFKPAPLFPVIVHQDRQMVEALRQKGQDVGGADLFFSYFNQRTYDELIDWQDHEDHNAH